MSQLPTSPALTRREALRRTVLFSTALLAGRFAPRAEAVTLDTSFTGSGLHLLALGDYGSKNESQRLVARQMTAFAQKLSQPLDAVLALGDNFYGKMTPDRFESGFEKMYDPAVLSCPFYACIGNHDYERAAYGQQPEPRKFEMELKYAADNPTSRWKMPAPWYTLELPNPVKPLVRIIVLDSNTQPGALTPQAKLEQKRFLEAEVATGTRAPWTWLVWHHPVFTQTTKREDNASLLRLVETVLKSGVVSLCIAGHDHNLQHLRSDDYPVSFLISGAGGAASYDVTPSKRGFAKATLGFAHFHVNETRVKAQFIDENGACLHAFRRGLDGDVQVVS